MSAKPGTLERLGLTGPETAAKTKALSAQMTKDGVETVRFVFSDQHGILRGKTLVADAVPSALRNGVTAPSSLLLKDTSGRTVFPVWGEDAGFGRGVMTGAGDLLLVPDMDSYMRLPWSPHSAWVLCDVVQATGAPIPFAPRTVLHAADARLARKGYGLMVGLELEFHIFRRTADTLSHSEAGMPGQPPKTQPLNQGYQLLADSGYGSAEPILDDIRRTAQAMGLPIRSLEVEFGPSQFEVTFDPAPAARHAETVVLFRTMVKEICARAGLLATFMCRPVVPHAAASGWHVHQSLVVLNTGMNLFMPKGNAPTDLASQWTAGLLAHAAECAVLTTPTVNAYKRYQAGKLAPDRICWGRDNKGAMLRALFAPGDPASRIENRAPEPAATPHYLFAAQILSGLSGIEQGLTLPPPVTSPYEGDAAALPKSLGTALDAFEAGTLFSNGLGQSFHRYIGTLKRAEWTRYLDTLSPWEQREYLQLF